MKNIAIKLILSSVFLCGVFSCQDDTADNPSFGPDEVYVYDNKPGNQSAVVDVPLEMEMLVSPNDGSVDCRWLLDGTVISSQQNLNFAFEIAGTFTLRFEATKGTRTVIKTYNLTVSE